MRLRRYLVCVLGAAIGLASWALGQEKATQTPSLGDLARQQRAHLQKVKQEHPVRVWTNDNMPKREPGEGLTAASGISVLPVPPANQSEGGTPSTSAEASTSEASSSSSEAHDEKYYRQRMSELKSRLELHQRELAVLQQKASQGDMQYYADPNKTLQQEYSRSDINKINDQVTKTQEEIAADQKAIQDLQDQLRREGHPPGWLR